MSHQFSTESGMPNPLHILEGYDTRSFGQDIFETSAPYTTADSNSLMMGGMPAKYESFPVRLMACYDSTSGELDVQIDLSKPASDVWVGLPTLCQKVDFDDSINRIDLSVSREDDYIGISFIGNSGDQTTTNDVCDEVLYFMASSLKLVTCKTVAKRYGKLDW